MKTFKIPDRQITPKPYRRMTKKELYKRLFEGNEDKNLLKEIAKKQDMAKKKKKFYKRLNMKLILMPF